jgi:hypothetical protein
MGRPTINTPAKSKPKDRPRTFTAAEIGAVVLIVTVVVPLPLIVGWLKLHWVKAGKPMQEEGENVMVPL